SIGIWSDTVLVGSTLESTICIWKHGNELYYLKETVQYCRVEFMVLLKGTKPEPVFCPVGTGTILLNRSYTLSKPGTFTFSMAQPDGQFQDRVVVVE
ncbi:MAG: hypothetical protein JJU37_03965, partial [Balneolaceae bacterium]|nr:hypothetical protein [Balneolaceae bacterium]